MDYKSAIMSALDGRCLLFLGAGFSRGARTISGEEILHAKGLANKLCELVNVECIDDLKYAADDFIDEIDNIDRAIEELCKLLKVNKIQEYHKVIASVPWRYVYTTNYDNVYEYACRENNKNYYCVSISQDIKNIPTHANVVVHINGMIENLTRDTIGSEFKLTNESYASSSFMDSAWYEKFIRDIKIAEAIFFVGYSMYDIDIQKLFYRAPELKEKTFFILGKGSSSRITRNIAKVGILVPDKTACEFAEDIERAKSNFSKTSQPYIFSSFEKTDYNSYSKKDFHITINDIFKMYIYGEYDINKIYYDIANETNSYYVKRKDLMAVFDNICNGGVNNVLINSEFGNGKTLFIEGLKALCATKHIDCYQLIDELDTATKELSCILENTNKQVVIIENYSKYRKFVRHIIDERSPNTYLVITERTVNSALFIEELFSKLSYKVYSICLDRIDDAAVNMLISIFDSNALWQDLSKISKEAKYRKLTEYYKASFANILLGLLKSKTIRERLNDIFMEINKNSVYKKIVTLSCVLSIINVSVDLYTILAMLNLEINNRIVFDTNRSISQLFNNTTYKFTAKSPIFARFILTECSDGDYIISVLLSIYKYCSDRKSYNNKFLKIIHALDLFSTIQSILPEKNKLILSSKYFDEIRSLNNNFDNFHFWLQVAICQTVCEDFEKAEICFNTAYSLFEKSAKTNRQMLDNHYGRFLILRACKQEDTNFFKNFECANMIVRQQLKKSDTRYYPYRIILAYNRFYMAYENKMTEEQKVYFLSQSRAIYSSMENLNEAMMQNKYVQDAKKALEQILNIE